MSTPATPAPPAPAAKADVKTQSTQARDSRLTLRKTNEEVLRKALQNEARKMCASETQAFSECARANGLSVVISCRAQNKTMSDCMARYYTEEIFAQFLKEGGHPPAQPPRETLVGTFLNMINGNNGKT